MNREQIIDTLLAHQHELRHRGVLNVALFGSTARGDTTSTSDIDIMIEIEPNSTIGVFEYIGIKQYIANLFDEPVDVVDREGLKPYVRPAVAADAIYAF